MIAVSRRAAVTFAFAAGFFIQARLLASARPARVWEDTLNIPTYQEGLPIEEPRMAVFSPDDAVYPYTMRTRLLNREHLETWRVVHLENQYLACSVLPDLGGHLYRCIDKADGHDIFHPALCIKKQLIAPRGAWISTGIEFNFPVGHSLVTISPVDYRWAQGADGSASVWVGDRDRVEDLDWRVRISLRPGSRVIEQEVTLYNPGVQQRRYYWWANAAVSPGSRTGLAHWAKYEDVPGKKLWLLKPSDLAVSDMRADGRRAANGKRDTPPGSNGEAAGQSPDDLAKIAFSRMGAGDLEGAASILSLPQLATVSANENLRTAFYELRLQQAISTARSRNCTAVSDQLATLTTADPQAPYTHPGGVDFVENPRTLFLIGRTYGLCSNSKAALSYWKRAAAKKVDAESAEAVFRALARIQLAAYDGKPPIPLLQEALQEARERLAAAAPEQKAAAQYRMGILLQALGRLSDSDDRLEQAEQGTGTVNYWAAVGLRDNDLARQGVK